MDLLIHNNSLFRCTDHAVVKGFGDHKVRAGPADIHIFVDIAGNVAGADAQSGFSAAVSRLDHTGTPGGQDQGDSLVLHQRCGGFQGRGLDPLDAVFRRAILNSGLFDNAGRLRGAFLSGRVKRKYNGIPGFCANQGFEYGGGSGIGNRGNAGNDSHRFGNFHVILQLIFLNHTYGFLMFDAVIDIFRGKNVLDDLVFEQASFCLIHGKMCQIHMLVQPGQGHGLYNPVHLLLVQFHIFLQGLLRIGYQTIHHFPDVCGSGFRILHCFIFLFHKMSSLSLFHQILIPSNTELESKALPGTMCARLDIS